jgi:hypothetical protein
MLVVESDATYGTVNVEPGESDRVVDGYQD